MCVHCFGNKKEDRVTKHFLRDVLLKSEGKLPTFCSLMHNYFCNPKLETVILQVLKFFWSNSIPNQHGE